MDSNSSLRSVRARVGQVAVYGLYELDIAVTADYNNPYDPKQIDLTAEFHSPSGKAHQVIGFFAPASDDNGAADWHVRFTPSEPGAWTYQVRVRTPQVDEAYDGSFQVTADRCGSGFLRISNAADSLPHFVYEDGTPYFAVGENLAWSDKSFQDYEEWLPRLADSGANFIRLWMASWSFALEWDDTGLGDYTKRQKQADQLDYLFGKSQRLGIVVMLALQNHGQFAITMNPQWSENPYNKALGGPLDQPEEFFTSPEAKKLAKQRYRYIVARYGHYTNLLTWELFNEVDLTENYNSAAVGAWHQEMSDYLRSIDPYQHLVTTSFSNPDKDDSVFAMPGLDFANTHFYHVSDMVAAVIRCDQDRLNKLGKATFSAEFGPDTEGPTLADKQGVNVHNGLWAGAFSGATGTPMTWWWDTYIHPFDLYSRFSSLTKFLGPAEWLNWSLFTPQVSDKSIRAFGRHSADQAMLWLQDPHHIWSKVVAGYEPETISDLTVEVELPDGEYEAAFWDTWQGQWMKKELVKAENGRLRIAVPSWQRDIAARITPSK